MRAYRPVIRSVVQAVSPEFTSRLMYLREPNAFRRPAERVREARLVQQWAHLRTLNASAAVAIENLALRFGNLRRDFAAMLQALHTLRSDIGKRDSSSHEVGEAHLLERPFCFGKK